MIFRGTFEHALDAKNRLTVPAKYREALAGRVVLAFTPESAREGARCLSLWIPSDYEDFVIAVTRGLNPLDPRAVDLENYLNANSWECDVDSANRVMVPGLPKQLAGLEKDVVITGAGKCLRIWEPATYASYNAGVLARFPEIAASLDHTD